MGELVASRYASALFEASKDLEKEDKFHNDMDLLNSVIEENDDFLKVLSHPRIRDDEKKAIVNEIFKDHVSHEIVNYIYILIDKRREKNLPEIISTYNKIYDEYRGIVNVTATTVVPMNDVSKNNLINEIESKLNKSVRLTNIVDSSIIGGVYLQIDGRSIDGTLKSELESISRAII